MNLGCGGRGPPHDAAAAAAAVAAPPAGPKGRLWPTSKWTRAHLPHLHHMTHFDLQYWSLRPSFAVHGAPQSSFPPLTWTPLLLLPPSSPSSPSSSHLSFPNV
uniref:Uncharacterized protein n=1 Tax=Cucumis sativus TaxID=3659 RepID=A0A0A0K9Q2_CUCSA